MSPPRSLTLFAIITACVLFSFTISRSMNRAPMSPSAEVLRVQQHIAAAERFMAARSLSGLTPSQRKAREHLVATLARYRLAGRFPHNHDFPAERVPYFVDAHGTLCAVAYLIASTGRVDIVSAVHDKMNNARVPDIANDPDLGPPLRDWLAVHGITLAEAAAIQPGYELPVEEEPRTMATGAYKAASVTAYAASAVGFVANTLTATRNVRTAWPFLNIISGVGAVTLSVPELDERGSRRTFAYLNMGVGVASFIAGTVAWMIRPDAMPEVHRVAPITGTDSQGRSQLGLRITF